MHSSSGSCCVSPQTHLLDRLCDHFPRFRFGFGIIIPIQPFYAEAFVHALFTVDDAWRVLLCDAIFCTFLGQFSDRIGRRPVILFSIAINIFGYLLFGLAGSLGMLFAARMLSGFGSANIGAIQAVIADSTPPSERAKGMGIIGAAFWLLLIFWGQPSVQHHGPVQASQAPAFSACGVGVFNFFLAPSAFARNPPCLPRPFHTSQHAALFTLKRGKPPITTSECSLAVCVVFYLYNRLFDDGTSLGTLH